MSDQQQPPSQEQPSLFDAQPSGAALRDRGIAAVVAADVAVNRNYRPHVDAALGRLAASGREFTSDDLWTALPDDVAKYAPPNLVSASIRIASTRGEIQCTGLATSSRPSRHRGAVRTWRGTTTSHTSEKRSA